MVPDSLRFVKALFVTHMADAHRGGERAFLELQARSRGVLSWTACVPRRGELLGVFGERGIPCRHDLHRLQGIDVAYTYGSGEVLEIRRRNHRIPILWHVVTARRDLYDERAGEAASAIVLNAAHLATRLPLCRHKAVVIRNAPASRFYQANRGHPGRRAVLFIGPPTQDKGFDELRRCVDRLQLELVAAHGDVPDVLPLLETATLLAMPSHTEGMPSAVLEAAAARVPLVLSDIPAHREAVQSNALYHRVGDETRLEECIRQVLERPDEAVARAALALDALENSTMEESIDRLIRALLSTGGIMESVDEHRQ
jgi:glycosyltransferase involved in cell wall biosynthesis